MGLDVPVLLNCRWTSGWSGCCDEMVDGGRRKGETTCCSVGGGRVANELTCDSDGETPLGRTIETAALRGRVDLTTEGETVTTPFTAVEVAM